MGEQEQVQIQEPIIGNSPRSMGDHIHGKKKPIVANSSRSIMSQEHISTDVQNPQLRDSEAEPTDLFSMLRLNSTATTGCHHHRHHPPCTTGSFGSNTMKRRSPSPQDPSGANEPRPKKLFCDHDDLTLHGFSTISLPLSLGTLAANNKAKQPCPVLRRCVSDPYNPPAANPFHSPEHVNGGGNTGTPSSMRGYGLPPLPPSLRRSVSDLTPSPAKSFLSRSSSSEETPNSMRLRRMKDRLREMRQWWDEVMRDEEEEEEDDDECAVAEDDKVPSQDDLGGDSEEAVSVEWAEKCVSITFRCPCGKGYEVLLSANNCYYKLV